MDRYHISPVSAKASIASAYVTYLLHFEGSTILTDDLAREFPFINYAAEFWPSHYKDITDDTEREVIDFLGLNLVES